MLNIFFHNFSSLVCPDGYFYAGEDTEKLTKDIWLEEKDRSPEYSCYKVIFFHTS